MSGTLEGLFPYPSVYGMTICTRAIESPDLALPHPSRPTLMTQPYVLLADSDRRYEQLLTPHLEATGFRFACAYSTKEARSLALLEMPSVLLLDLDHNAREGVRLLLDLRSRDKNVPVLWVSSHVGALEIEKVKAAGAQGLLWKDADGHTTVRAIRTVSEGGTFFEDNQPTRKSSGIRSLSMDERLSKLVRG